MLVNLLIELVGLAGETSNQLVLESLSRFDYPFSQRENRGLKPLPLMAEMRRDTPYFRSAKKGWWPGRTRTYDQGIMSCRKINKLLISLDQLGVGTVRQTRV